MPSEPTRYQFSSRLGYNQKTPAFLQRMKNQVAGVTNDEDEDFDQWQASSGRPPIPRRPSPPRRPDDDPGSADEDDDDEKPQVVVLREGKHMTAREVENERRKARGLPPLTDPQTSKKADAAPESTDRKDLPSSNLQKAKEPKTNSLSFASSASSSKAQSKKRKALDSIETDERPSIQKESKKVKKRAKKTGVLLSFGDGIDG